MTTPFAERARAEADKNHEDVWCALAFHGGAEWGYRQAIADLRQDPDKINVTPKPFKSYASAVADWLEERLK